ncbi:response regulator [Massilia sp. PWRC2]|uniref:response regulator n=1 Tax=Massilia sp. PWRC2 TaxID=2804626 RepID=UPI003CF92061
MSSLKKTTPVIIADDDAPMRELLASLMRSHDYTFIAFASDGAQAAQLMQAPEYQQALVFLDIHMPGSDGLAVLAEARTRGSRAFVVMVSADSALDKVMAALGAGAGGFVIKPYSAQRIADMVDKFERENG